MSSSSSSFTTSALLRPCLFVAFSAVATVAAAGCSGKIAEPPTGGTASSVNGTNGSSGASGASGSGGTTTPASPSCASKACGVDCTPEGSDEPFNCNNKGECVATGAPLACHCPEFLADCRQGEGPVDTDGDGCIDACRPVK